jgi:hypothetical protein
MYGLRDMPESEGVPQSTQLGAVATCFFYSRMFSKNILSRIKYEIKVNGEKERT